jgi:hypothetical protein
MSRAVQTTRSSWYRALRSFQYDRSQRLLVSVGLWQGRERKIGTPLAVTIGGFWRRSVIAIGCTDLVVRVGSERTVSVLCFRGYEIYGDGISNTSFIRRCFDPCCRPLVSTHLDGAAWQALVPIAAAVSQQEEVGRESMSVWNQIFRDESPEEGDNENDQPAADSCLATSIRGEGRTGRDTPCCRSESAHGADQHHRLTRIRGISTRHEQDNSADEKTQRRNDLSHPEERLRGKRPVRPTVRVPMKRHVLGQLIAPSKPGQEHDECRNTH